jgi:hypothetical protein
MWKHGHNVYMIQKHKQVHGKKQWTEDHWATSQLAPKRDENGWWACVA